MIKELWPFWPQIYVIVTIAFTCIKSELFAGQTRKRTIQKGRAIFLYCFGIFALVCGGLFHEFGWPQFIYVGLSLMVLAMVVKFEFGANLKTEYTVNGTGISAIILPALLYWGDFFDTFINYLTK